MFCGKTDPRPPTARMSWHFLPTKTRQEDAPHEARNTTDRAARGDGLDAGGAGRARAHGRGRTHLQHLQDARPVSEALEAPREREILILRIGWLCQAEY